MAARVLFGRNSKHTTILKRILKTSSAFNSGETTFVTPSSQRVISSLNDRVLSKKNWLGCPLRWNLVRTMSNENSEKKRESSVFNELMEAKEQPQTQLTVGAKGEMCRRK